MKGSKFLLFLLVFAFQPAAVPAAGEQPGGSTGAALPAFSLPFPPGAAYRLLYGPGDPPHHLSPRNRHAYDFALPYGALVTAAESGVVVKTRSAGRGPTGRSEDNNYVAIRHPGGLVSEYHHLLEDGVLVRVGERIQRGEAIGFAGATGRAEGPHLHFVVVRGDTSVPVRFREYAGTPAQGEVFRSENVPVLLEARYRSLERAAKRLEALERLGAPPQARALAAASALENLAGPLQSTGADPFALRRSRLALRVFEREMRLRLEKHLSSGRREASGAAPSGGAARSLEPTRPLARRSIEK